MKAPTSVDSVTARYIKIEFDHMKHCWQRFDHHAAPVMDWLIHELSGFMDSRKKKITVDGRLTLMMHA